MQDHFLYVEKYRPKTVADTILPTELKITFQQFVDQKNIPNLILAGSAGVGKTTIARAMLEELGCDYIVINGSMNGNIDTLRNEILQFASAMSLSGGRKYVILDEADYLNPNSTQPALRNFMEEFAKNCGFILTCNFKNRIIDPLHSRCSVIDFKLTNEDKPKMAAAMFKRTCEILVKENIQYNKQVVAELITKFFPDNRRILNEIQRYGSTGKIDTGILSDFNETNQKKLVSYLKDKKFNDVRRWVAENSDVESTVLFRSLYDTCSEYLKAPSIPQLVLILADYQYKAAWVADAEINTTACLTEIMAACDFI
jgi:DNA polymerase III delta prime subunit